MIQFKGLEKKYFPKIIRFADKHIGINYFDNVSLEKLLEQSSTVLGSTSLLAFDKGKLIAIRLTRNNGSGWHLNKDIHPELWNLSLISRVFLLLKVTREKV